MTVFLDDFALLTPDPDHSVSEDRYILLGMSETGRTLVVCHAYRSDDDVVRIIPARKASSRELKYLEEKP